MNIKNMIKQAHNNAIKRGAYICQNCEGIIGACPECGYTGKSPKLAVYWKIKEENKEFLHSQPSKTFHKNSEQSEIADIIIVMLAYCGEMNYDIEKHIIEKMNYNDVRED